MCKLSPISYHDHSMGMIGKKSCWQLTFPMLVARLPDSNLHISHDWDSSMQSWRTYHPLSPMYSKTRGLETWLGTQGHHRNLGYGIHSFPFLLCTLFFSESPLFSLVSIRPLLSSESKSKLSILVSVVFTQLYAWLSSLPNVVLWSTLISFAGAEMGLREEWLQKGVVQFCITLRKNHGSTRWNSCTKCLHIKKWLITNCGQVQTKCLAFSQ